MTTSNIILWLDDFRNPMQKKWLDLILGNNPDEGDVVVWIKDYAEFVQHITVNGIPKTIWFDHDLGDFQALHAAGYIDGELPNTERTGYDCAKWLVEYCMDKKLNLPQYFFQTSNTVGRTNIESLFKSYKKWQRTRN